jgi:3-hydroxybutyryl-CoA dehydrogenase
MHHVPTTIQSVAVVGAGQMGAGIAQVMARAGLDVALSDQMEEQATQAVAKMEARLRRQESDGKLPAGASSELLARLRTGGPLFGVAEADLIVEAAPDRCRS